MDELLKEWRECYDNMMLDTADLRAQTDTLYEMQRVVEAPYEQRMKELEVDIKAAALGLGCSHTAHGAMVAYRSGYELVSYDSGKTDMVLGLLRDVLPETASVLDGARKVSFVKPSVSVRAVDKEEK